MNIKNFRHPIHKNLKNNELSKIKNSPNQNE